MSAPVELRPEKKSGGLTSNLHFNAVDALSIPVRKLIQEARDRLLALDLPGSRNEYWKYTRTGRLARLNLNWPETDTSDGVELSPIADLSSLRFVFDNHKLAWQPQLLPDGLTVAPIQEALQTDERCIQRFGTTLKNDTEYFTTLNTSQPEYGLFVHVRKGVEIETPVEIVLNVSGKGNLLQPRHMVVLEEGAALQIIWRVTGADGEQCLLNSVMESFVAQTARLRMHKIQECSGEVYQVHREEASLERDCYFKLNTLTLQGGWVRNEANIAINGPGIDARLNGLYLLKDSQHVDNRTIVDHRAPNSESRELYKGVLDGGSTGVFNGKVFVRQPAQKTNAYQSNGNILLSDNAVMNSKPELEIYADDVKCSHGSTTGQLDEEAMFYLRARGIGREQARLMLVEAFVGEVTDAISNIPVREYVHRAVSAHFGHYE